MAESERSILISLNNSLHLRITFRTFFGSFLHCNFMLCRLDIEIVVVVVFCCIFVFVFCNVVLFRPVQMFFFVCEFFYSRCFKLKILIEKKTFMNFLLAFDYSCNLAIKQNSTINH